MTERQINFAALKELISMEQVLSWYGISTVKGRAVCPFHDDRHPSMKVYEDGFYCFACGAGGDVIKFVAMNEHIGNVGAARLIEERLGIVNGGDEDCKLTRKLLQARHKTTIDAKAWRIRIRHRHDSLCSELRRINCISMSAEPYSEEWCEAVSKRPHIEAELNELDRLYYERSSTAGGRKQR